MTRHLAGEMSTDGARGLGEWGRTVYGVPRPTGQKRSSDRPRSAPTPRRPASPFCREWSRLAPLASGWVMTRPLAEGGNETARGSERVHSRAVRSRPLVGGGEAAGGSGFLINRRPNWLRDSFYETAQPRSSPAKGCRAEMGSPGHLGADMEVGVAAPAAEVAVVLEGDVAAVGLCAAEGDRDRLGAVIRLRADRGADRAAHPYR